MKSPFSFSLTGPEWSRLYFWYWIPSLLLAGLNWIAPAPRSDDGALFSLLITLAIAFLSVLLQSYFAVPILRTWMPRFSLDGRSPAFYGDITEYLVLNVRGFLLSVVTLGFYLPWYGRDVMAYLCRETRVEGRPSEFHGKPLPLLWQFLGVLLLAVIVAVVLVVTVFARLGLLNPASPAFEGATIALALVLSGPAVYVYYAWLVQVTVNEWRVRWTTKLVPASGVVMLQLVFTVLSLGLWAPGAFLVLYRYFVAHTVAEHGDERLSFVFEGALAEGWAFLWGQILLTVVTVGFYGAWSAPAATRWLAERTFAIRAS